MDINPLGIWKPLDKSPVAIAPRAVSTGVSRGRALSGGRVSMDDPNTIFNSSLSFLSPFSGDEYWRTNQLDTKTLNRVNPSKLMELLADISPDVSRALWDFLLMCAPGWTVKAFKPGTETEDKNAQAAIDAFLLNLHGSYAAPNVTPAKVVIGSIFMQGFMRGAFCGELVLDETGRMPLEIATPDPAHIRFQKVEDAARGQVWQMFQWQRGEKVLLDRPTICYVPIHPFPGQPYGRPLASPALFTTVFLISILHDIRRVVQQQGWPRIDIAVEFEKLVKMMPAEDAADSARAKAWLEGAFTDIMAAYNSLEPDHAYVHPDAVKVNQPVGAMNASGLGAVDGIIKGLERMSIRALKTLPLLMASSEGASEANANRQWEVFAAGIKSLQQLCEPLLERLLTLALQAQGLAAKVQFRFAELRAAELLRDAQTEALQISNEARKRDEGWITNDDAANKIAGHKAVGEPKGVATPANAALTTINPEPGSNRAQEVAELLFATYRIETGYLIPYKQWWQERLDDPPTHEEAYERLKRKLVSESSADYFARVSRWTLEAGGVQ